MDPSLPLSRRSILRLIPAAAVAATAVVLSAKEALAKEPAQQAVAAETPAGPGHRAIIGML
ncbi:hypothetical protein [Paenarthrobacter nicotinovorans]|uniref:hypothetical protein n=1 Tax=Paenarthrobacter nicotinovorans TaxID=29320 RepID=UPI0011A74B5F|nr:hypothetical protein [Paenarthrobacter nicotinovorans]